MQEAGIGRIVNIGADLASTASSIALADQYPFVYAAAGVHPSDAGQLNEQTFQWLGEQAEHEKVVAIGEIGLDYYWEKDPKARANQQYWFRRQMNLPGRKNFRLLSIQEMQQRIHWILPKKRSYQKSAVLSIAFLIRWKWPENI